MVARPRGSRPDAIRAIQAHRWPGNVRELENRVKGAVIMAESAVVSAMDLGLQDPGNDPEYLNLRRRPQKRPKCRQCARLLPSHARIFPCRGTLGITRPTLYDLLAEACTTPRSSRATRTVARRRRAPLALLEFLGGQLNGAPSNL